MISLQDWVAFLKSTNGAAGLPLIIAGLALTLFGWRMWRICVILAYGFIGAALGSLLSGPGQNEWLFATVGGVLLAALSYKPMHHAITLLGGLIGGGVVVWSLSEARVAGPALWIAGACAMAASTALAALNRQRVVIGVTAFLGAVCLVSGLVCWIMPWPAMYGTVNTLAGQSVFVTPFLVIVPTVMSCFFQVAEIRRLNVEL